MSTVQGTEQTAAGRFAGRLRELRTAAGLSRAELAALAGLRSPMGVRNLEQGRRHPLWATAVALASALGVSLDAFLDRPAATAKRGRGRPRKAVVG